MCIAPSTLPDGTAVPCRACWMCNENRINDLVGRCIAEQQTSDQTFSVTLTYAGDTPNAAVLCYRDIQMFLWRFRKAGFKPRYIVAGEYGEKNGRAHWHFVVFLKGKTLQVVEFDKRDNDWQVVLPRFKDDKEARIQFAPWSNPAEGRGFVYFQSPDYGGLRYAMKYAIKDQGQGVEIRALGMSKKPPLGHAFFMNMADNLVEAGLPVQLPTYAFKGMKNKKGKHLQFCLKGRMREMFLDHYQIAWRLVHGGEPPASPWYQEKYLDKIERDYLAVNAEHQAEVQRMADIDKAFDVKSIRWARDYRLEKWCEIRPNWLPGLMWCHKFRHKGRQASITLDWYHAYVDLNDGGPEWQIAKGDKTALERQLLQTGLKQSAMERVCEWLLFVWSEEFASFSTQFLSKDDILKTPPEIYGRGFY